jgi:glycosyltransferase involved in cell wall biosynthesis
VGTLIRAYAEAAPEAGLMIVGDGPYRGEYEALAERLGVAGRIRFTGYLSGEALSRAVGDSLAVVIPSEWYENCPYSVMEALAAGKPVVGARIGGIPEMVTEGETGFLFESGSAGDLADALTKAAGLSKAAYAALSENARAYARANFSARDYVKRLEGEYRKLLERKGAPRWGK